MNNTLQRQIDNINDQIKLAELYAQWWMARALTGEAKQRQISHGDGSPLTEEEKTADALNTAHNHIRRISSLIDTKSELLDKLNTL